MGRSKESSNVGGSFMNRKSSKFGGQPMVQYQDDLGAPNRSTSTYARFLESKATSKHSINTSFGRDKDDDDDEEEKVKIANRDSKKLL